MFLERTEHEFNEGRLERGGYGEGEREYRIFVKGLLEEEPDREILLTVAVGERKYTVSQAEEILDDFISRLQTAVAGENPSLDQVTKDLNLVDSLEGYGFLVSWETEDWEWIDSLGHVKNKEAGFKEQKTTIKAHITDGRFKWEHEFAVTLLPETVGQEEQAAREFLNTVATQDIQQNTKEYLMLPKSYNGRSLAYRRAETSDLGITVILAAAGVLLIAVRKRGRKEREQKEREKLLLMDYSEVVSKLIVLTGAGFTLRSAWGKIASEYELGKQKNEKLFRPAYEEMANTWRQLEGGMPESRAYGEFAARCGILPYRKLVTLLEQNRKNGGRELRIALELEMSDAFEKRKHLARQLGEEAGTKLLVPLFLLLGIVMVLIAAPAFMGL